MLKKLLLFSILGVTPLAAMADTISVKSLLKSGSYAIRKPIQIDSVNVKKEAYSEKILLTSAFNPMTPNLQAVQADASGYFLPAQATDNYEISLFRFYVRSDRYAKATLEVKSPGMLEVYVDGSKKTDKTSVQDSLNVAGKASSELTLEPGQKEITIKYLASPQSKTAPAFLVNIIPSKNDSMAQISASINPSHPMTIEDLMTGTRLGRPSVSADGLYAMLNESTVLSGGKRVARKKIIRMNDGSLVADVTDKNDIVWLPNSPLLGYTATGLDGRELRTLNPSTMKETLLCNNLPAGSFNWSPDESYLIFSIKSDFPASKNDLQQIITPDDRQPGWRDRYSLYKYTIANGLMEQLTFGYHNTWLNDISEDSKKILFTESEVFITERPFRRSSFYQLDLESFRLDTIWYQIGFVNSIQYSPDSKKLFVLGSGESFDGIGLNIKPGQIANMYDVQGYIYDMSSKKAEPVTRDFNPSILSARWNKYDNKIYLTTTDRDFVDVYAYDVAKGNFDRLPLNVDVVSGFDLASNGHAVYGGQSTSHAERAFSYNLKNKKSSLLSDPQQQQIADYELGEVKDWNFVSTDGTNIEGRYYLPTDFDPAKKYPMIVYYYSGTTPTDRSFFHPYSMHLYAAQGYVVYTLQPSGTIGYGQEFAARHVNAWGIQTADDIICGVKKFCEEHPFVNASKVGCMGASYGGFMTMYLQTRTDIFAAAVAHAGISSLSSYWGEGYWGYSYSAAASAHSYPWNNPELYVKQSPLFNADKINTPLLLLHGKVDTNVPVGESIQMFTALKLLGKQVDFIQVEGENHGIMDFKRRLAWKKSIFAYLAKWLKDEPQWWEAQYPLLELE